MIYLLLRRPFFFRSLSLFYGDSHYFRQNYQGPNRENDRVVPYRYLLDLVRVPTWSTENDNFSILLPRVEHVIFRNLMVLVGNGRYHTVEYSEVK